MAIVFVISVSCSTVFAAENNICTPEEMHLKKAILEESSSVKISSIPVDSEEEAYQLIKELEESTKTIEVEVSREVSNTTSVKSMDVAKVLCRPTYGYRKGHVEVYLKIWVEGGGIGT